MNLALHDASSIRRGPSATLRKTARLLTALVVLFISVTGCASGEKKGDAGETGDVRYQIGEPVTDSTVAAIVTSEYGSDTLSTAEFRSQMEMVEMQFPQITNDPEQHRELRRSLVEQFVLRHAVGGEFDRLALAVDTAQVEDQIRQYRAQAGSDEAFAQILAANNMTEDSLRSSVRDYLRQQRVLEHMAESAAEPSEEELEGFRQDRAQQVRASHILFLTQGANATAQDSIRRQAEAVLDSIKSGADFAELARRHSQDGTAATGGDLGFFSRGQMVEPFEEATYALADSGDVTQELVETRFGFHIIRLTGRRTGTMMDTTQARAMMMQQRREDAVESGIDVLRGKVTVRINDAVVDADLNERPEGF